MANPVLRSKGTLNVTSVAALALATSIAVACADDPVEPGNGTGGGAGKGGTSSAGGSGNTAGSVGTGGSTNTGGSINTGGTGGSINTGGTGNSGGTMNTGGSTTAGTGGGAGTAGTGGTGGDPGAAGMGGDPGMGAGGMGGDPGTGAGGDPAVGGAGGAPVGPENLFAGSGFETNTAEGWLNRTATASPSDVLAHSGTYSLYVTDRTDTWQGTEYNLMGIVDPGVTYTVTVWAALATGATSSTLRLSGQYKCGDDPIEYPWIENTTGNVAEAWVELSGNFSIPADCVASQILVYVEGPAAGDSYYIDDVSLYEN